MAETEQVSPFSMESVVEDVLQQHATGLGLVASMKAKEASLRRYEATEWLRKTVGVVMAKNLPAEPSEEDFRLGLRSGIILCNALNKVQPWAIPKVVVEGPVDYVLVPDGETLSSHQYFENVRTFLAAMETMGIPLFEVSDLEQGGKSTRIVNCVLALKDYAEWKKKCGVGTWKLGWNTIPIPSGKPFVRNNSEPIINCLSRTSSAGEQAFLGDLSQDLSEAVTSRKLDKLVRQVLSDKKQEEIPLVVEALLEKVVEEFEQRLANQVGTMRAEGDDQSICPGKPLSTTSSTFEDSKVLLPQTVKAEDDPTMCPRMPLQTTSTTSEDFKEESVERREKAAPEIISESHGQLTTQLMKHQSFVLQQHRHIKELQQALVTTKAEMKILHAKYMEEFGNIGKQMHGVANAASGYQKVLEENRRLYNQVQDLKGNIRVYCRVRPFLPGQPSGVNSVANLDKGSITIITSSKNGKEAKKSFTFNRVFGPSATQAEVFADTQPLVRSVLDGYNVCIFAYGQTGSGKTHTMTGPKELTEEHMGVNFRALSDLFQIGKQRKDVIAYDIFVQMIEIYNEQVRDLLVADGSIKRVEIRNSSKNGINVPEASLVPVSSIADVVHLMNLGHKNRAVSSTALNDRSSRSHSCLTVHVQGKGLTSGSTLRGSMHLVDLAGSERVDKSEVVGDQLKEAQHINKSLAALGDVISSLAQKNSHVPFRNSKLTQLLQDSLGGQAKTLMFVHISPEPDAVVETVSTLKFAERVSSIELGAARVNKDSSDVKDLKEQISSLKSALARKDSEGEQYSSSNAPETPSGNPAQSSSNLSWASLVSMPYNASQQANESIEDIFDNLEVENNTVPQPKRQSFDLEDFLANSPWPPVTNQGRSKKDDNKEPPSGEWVDKVMMKGVVSWEVNSPKAFGLPNGYKPEYTKVYPETERGDVRRSDQITSDLDSKISKSGLGPKNTKKPQLKTTKSSSEMRSMIPSLIPNLSKKASNGVSPATNKTRPTGVQDGMRRTGK